MERPFDFLGLNPRQRKPRARGLTEIRGPYYSVLGTRYLTDLLEVAGEHVDSLKFAGGAFAVMPGERVRELIDLCHRHDVHVSTGGFIERVLIAGPGAVDRYLSACRGLGFDTVEISNGFVTVPEDDLVGLVRRAIAVGLKAKPEVGVLFGAGAGTPSAQQDLRPIDGAIRLAKRYLDAGAELVMMESEGLTEQVASWRTEAIGRMAAEIGTAHLMFEAADPSVFTWYVKTYGPSVNLFVDHSQILQLACLRAGAWGPADVWGRVWSYEPDLRDATAGEPDAERLHTVIGEQSGRQGERRERQVVKEGGIAESDSDTEDVTRDR